MAGITKEEITAILAEANVLSPSIVDAVDKIIQINNKSIIDAVKDVAYNEILQRLQREMRRSK